MQYDVFISHSSHDKESVARPLSKALVERGLTVWLDEGQLHVGDSIRRDIEDALKQSHYLVAILSPDYLQSEWCQKELDAFFSKEKHQSKSIFPVYHGISVEDVERHWLFLADKVALNNIQGIRLLADKIHYSILKSDNGDLDIMPSLKGVPKPSILPFFGRQFFWVIVVVICILLVVLSTNKFETKSVYINNSSQGSVQVDQSTRIISNYSDSIDEAELAERLVQKMGLPNKQDLQAKDNKIKMLIETISRLKKQPGDEHKQAALKKLNEDKPKEAARLLERSLVEREGLMEVQSKNMATDWIDLGNILGLNNPEKALEAYAKAIKLDPKNISAWNDRSVLNMHLGNLTDAAAELNEAEKLSVSGSLWSAKVNNNLGNLYSRLGKFEEAEKSQRKALKLYETLGRQDGVAASYTNIGSIYRERGKLTESLNFQLKSLEIEEELGNQVGMVRQYTNVGIAYHELGELNTAVEFHIKALKGQEILGLKYGEANSYSSLGMIYIDSREFDKAYEYLSKSLEIHNANKYQEGIAEQYSHFCLAKKLQSLLSVAKDFCYKSLKIFNSYDNQYGVSIQYSTLSNIYAEEGDLVKAEEFALKSIEIDKSLGRDKSLADTYNNLGAAYSKKGDLVKSEELYLKALQIYKKNGRKERNAMVYENLSLIYQRQGKTESDKTVKLEALKIYEEFNNLEKMSVMYVNLGQIYFMSKELDKAEIFFLKSIKTLKKLGDEESLAYGYSTIGLLYYELEDLNNTCKYWQLSAKSADTVGDSSLKSFVKALLSQSCPPSVFKIN